ncbi:hypothetical protein, partial [Amnibacterium endophyticum]
RREPAPAPAPRRSAARLPSRRGVLLPVGALAASGAALLLVGTPGAPRPARTAPVRDVQRAALGASTTEGEREGFVRALADGGRADLTGWLERHRRAGDARWEHVGAGTRLLRLALPRRAGRVEVLVVAAERASVSWTLLDAAGGTPVDLRSLVVTPGDVATGTLRYAAGAAPARLLVTAPEQVRWGAAVVAHA